MTEYVKVELTAEHKRAWEETRVSLLWSCPAFSHILYSMLDNSGAGDVAYFTKDVPIAATDGVNLLLNPDTFFTYPLRQRVFVVAHEIMHCIFNHCNLARGWGKRGKVVLADGSELPYSHELMNIALDLIINDLLITSEIGEFLPGGCHDTSIATKDDSSIDAYAKLYEKCDKAQGGNGKGTGQGNAGSTPDPNGKGGASGQGFDNLLAPGSSVGKDPDQAVADRSEDQWAAEVKAGMDAARVRGKLPAALERALGDMLDPKVDWREHIAALFARRVGSGGYDWRKPDRRLITRDIIAPARSGNGCGTVVVGIDTSGSIGQKELDMFFGEMAGILGDCQPNELIIVWCDAKVHRADWLDEPEDLIGVKKKGAPGGGGTAFEPVFDWIADNEIEPDALVYLTDGYGSFPQQAPSYPVIWGDIAKNKAYPWGDVVNIE